MVGKSISPYEALEQFGERLSQARNNLQSCEVLEAETSEAVDQAQGKFIKASEATGVASSELDNVQSVAIAAIEATGAEDDRDVATAVMLAKGKTKKEAKNYFEHLDRIEENEQPIVIVGRPGVTVISGMTKVIYGRTTGPKGNAILMGRDKPGSRKFVISITSRRGFATTMSGAFAPFSARVFAAVDQEKPEDVTVDQEQPFEEIHFARSRDEVHEIIDTVKSDENRTKLDDKIINALNVPSMVAYGESAVLELSTQLASRSIIRHMLVGRCLEGLGISGFSTSDFWDKKIPPSIKDDFYEALESVVWHTIEKGGEVVSPEEEMLAFLAPLQNKIDISEEQVLQSVKSHVEGRTRVRKSYNGNYRSVTDEDRIASREVERTAEKLSSLGVSVPNGPRIRRIGLQVELEAMKKGLRNHWPIINWYSRRKLKKEIKVVASAMAKATQ